MAQEALSPHEGKCERVVITTADGRTYDLGSPESPLFPLRLRRYKFARRAEMKKEGTDG